MHSHKILECSDRPPWEAKPSSDENHPHGYSALPVAYGERLPSGTTHAEVLERDYTLVEELGAALNKRVPTEPDAIAQECSDPALAKDSGMAWFSTRES